MKKRTANKILYRPRYFEWYYNGSIWSVAPKFPRLYLKAHKVLKLDPYYDADWLNLINVFKKKYGVREFQVKHK